MNSPLTTAEFDHLEFSVADAEASADDLTARYGFTVVARSAPDTATHRSIAMRQNSVLVVVTEGLDAGHTASGFVRAHGDGVSAIVLRVPDVRAFFDLAVAGGAKSLRAPVAGPDGRITASIRAFGDVRHDLVERSAAGPRSELPPGLVAAAGPASPTPVVLETVDHFAVCVEAGRLEEVIAFYRTALGFEKIFEERILVGTQAMNSQVVRNAAGDVTLTVIEPDSTAAPGQIDDFIRENGGAGVQHVAFGCDDIVKTVRILRDNGIEFLSTPGAYYDRLPGRVELVGHSVRELREQDVLADADHAGQLYQIFTRSTHPRRTLFFEVIERLGAETFGTNNIKALYEAIESERLREAE